MKWLLAALLAMSVLLSTESRAAEMTNRSGQQAVVSELIDEIRQELPKGWKVKYEAEFDSINIVREGVIAQYSTVPCQSVSESPLRQPYEGYLRVVPWVSPEEYKQWVAENKRLYDKQKLIAAKLPHSIVFAKPSGDGHLMENDSLSPEQKKWVKEYNQLRDASHGLPDYYFKTLSLEWGFDRFSAPADEKVLAETQALQKKIIALLSKYEP